LIEGFNVPAVDVGIIVASSSSVRQRIQSLGRVLRRHRVRDSEEKTSCIHVLYAADSAEEHIYGKVDWDAMTGLDRNRYFLWKGEGEPLLQPSPPRTPLIAESQIDAATLSTGAIYPGQYEGIELSCDSRGNVRNLAGSFAADTGELAGAILAVKGSGGKFRVTPKKLFVLVRIPGEDDWQTVYVARLREPLRFAEQSEEQADPEEAKRWQEQASLGDPYPFAGLPVIEGDVLVKQRGGGLITKKVPGGEVFARREDRATDTVKGMDARRVIEGVQKLRKAGKKVRRIAVNSVGHVTFHENGQAFFLCALEKGLEFPPVLA
jgi:hypothetical protein